MKPLFMWAGGKTRVLKHYLPILPKSGFSSYYEPFFGGGAMFVYVMKNYAPERVVVNDVNSNVMRIYRCIRDCYAEFISELDELEKGYMPLDKEKRKEYYMKVRHSHAYDFEKWGEPKEAATLYFLMKTGFNGIYQLNKNTNGRYGTPAGLLNQKKEVYDREVMAWWHSALQSVVIESKDWSEVVEDDPDGFFFFDPPYRNSFADYGNGFSEGDLLKLIEFADRQNNVFLSNRADDDWFEDKSKSLNVHYFNITYTAGRRKATDDGFEAKKAREILLYKVR